MNEFGFNYLTFFNQLYALYDNAYYDVLSLKLPIFTKNNIIT